MTNAALHLMLAESSIPGGRGRGGGGGVELSPEQDWVCKI